MTAAAAAAVAVHVGRAMWIQTTLTSESEESKSASAVDPLVLRPQSGDISLLPNLSNFLGGACHAVRLCSAALVGFAFLRPSTASSSTIIRPKDVMSNIVFCAGHDIAVAARPWPRRPWHLLRLSLVAVCVFRLCFRRSRF